jgi:3-oxoacyl-[acyl-carrier-protein] synthase-3
VVTNEDIAGPLGLDPDFIYRSSGISRRRWAASGTRTSSLAAEALRDALFKADIAAEEIDYLIFGTITPDRFIPGSGPSVQATLGLGEIPCLDIRAACCNALYGLQIARALIMSGAAHRVAICLAEVQSPWLDMAPRSGTISMLFGDGASALIVSDNHRPGAIEILDVHLATSGSYVDDLGIRCPGTEFGTGLSNDSQRNRCDHIPQMNGQSVILHASRRMLAASRSILERNGMTIADVRWVVPHQANANLLAKFARDIGLTGHQDNLVSVVEDLGNTSSASMGIALNSLVLSGKIRTGDHLLLPGFGAGFTWGAGLCLAR